MREKTKGARLRTAGGRGLRALLALCLAVTMAPAVAPTQQAEAVGQDKEVMLGTAAFQRHGLVYYGTYLSKPMQWMLINHPKTNAWEGVGRGGVAYPETSLDPANARVALMMSKDVLEKDDGTVLDGSTQEDWRNYLNNDFLNGFSEDEKPFMLKTQKYQDENKDDRDKLKGEKVFLIDGGEFATYVRGNEAGLLHSQYDNIPAVGIVSNKSRRWLLRYQEQHDAAFVKADGTDIDYGGQRDIPGSLRPFFSLNMDDVLFTTPANKEAQGELKPNENVIGDTTADTGAMKLTLQDSKRDTFSVSSPEGAQNPGTSGAPGHKARISYEHAQTGENEFLTAMVIDKSSNDVLNYGKITGALKNPDQASGTAEFTLPSNLKSGTTYTLRVFNEKVNGTERTDFANKGADIDFRVKQGVQASD